MQQACMTATLRCNLGHVRYRSAVFGAFFHSHAMPSSQSGLPARLQPSTPPIRTCMHCRCEVNMAVGMVGGQGAKGYGTVGSWADECASRCSAEYQVPMVPSERTLEKKAVPTSRKIKKDWSAKPADRGRPREAGLPRLAFVMALTLGSDFVAGEKSNFECRINQLWRKSHR